MARDEMLLFVAEEALAPVGAMFMLKAMEPVFVLDALESYLSLPHEKRATASIRSRKKAILLCFIIVAPLRNL